MKRISMILFTSAMLAIAFAATATAQMERGSIVGTITDKSGAVTPGVAVTVTNENTNATVVVSTDVWQLRCGESVGWQLHCERQEHWIQQSSV